MALYYTSAGKLWRAVWERWMQDAYGNVIPGTYSREKGKEFYYDGPRQRYLSRALDVSSEYPSQWKPTVEPQLWTDYLGDDPYADLQVVEKWDGVNEKWYIESQTEKLGYVAGYGTHAQQDAQTGATRYLHADLIDSTMMLTDENGAAPETLAYTAFGEPVGPGGVGVPPASDTRYRYAGGWGYEDDLLKLDGAPGTTPIVLLHVGWRWYGPALGRFVQRDPLGLGAGANLYAYVRNLPSLVTDPAGLGGEVTCDVVVFNGVVYVHCYYSPSFWKACLGAQSGWRSTRSYPVGGLSPGASDPSGSGKDLDACMTALKCKDCKVLAKGIEELDEAAKKNLEEWLKHVTGGVGVDLSKGMTH